MKFLYVIFIFLLTFLYSGCSTKKRVVAEIKELPAWYVNPPQSSSDKLYSIAEGENRADAIANALSEILSTLNVSVSSEFHTKSVVKEGDTQSVKTVSISDIKTQVDKIKVSNYRVIHSNEYGFERYLVLVELEKRKLFESLENSLKQNFLVVENRNREAQGFHSLKKLEAYKISIESIDEMRNTLLVMQALNPKFQSEKYIKQMNKLVNEYDRLRAKISFSIKSDTDAKNLTPVFQKGLSEAKYQIADLKNKLHYKIYIDSEIALVKSYGFDLARSAISIRVKDSRGIIVGSNKLSIIGQSTQGYKIAKEDIAIKLGAMVEKHGVMKVLGLEQ